MPVRGDMLKNYDAIKHDMLNTGFIENIALNSMNTINTGDNGSIKNLQWQGKNPSLDVLVSFRSITPGFISTTGMKMAEGREFLDEKADSTNIMVTESFAKLMGEGSALGKTITANNFALHIVGVVKDYIYGDLYGSPDPVLFSCSSKEATLMYVRTKPQQNIEQVLAKMEAVMKKYNAAYPFEYSFVDDQFNRQFTAEMLIGKLSRIFAVLAIIISCLGLFGLSAYTAERRTKEIGIRKVLGAGVANITGLLSKEFIQLVFLSSVIAFPVAWWAMNNWLQNYAYRVNINWWVFIAAGIVAIVIALGTISFQAIKAAVANPVKSLRSE
jgi:ABC-type antimicrobial peptide transport system permease subunit